MLKSFPVRLIVLATIALAFGLGSGALIVISGKSSALPEAAPAAAGSVQLALGKPAPEFTLNTLDGTPVSLKNFRGKKVLVNFWASWCGPCTAEAPDLQSAYDQLQKNEDVAFIGIGLQDKTKNLKAFVESNKLTYTIVEDNSGTTGDAYRVLAMPVSIFIATDGTLHKISWGTVTKDDVLKAFSEMR